MSFIIRDIKLPLDYDDESAICYIKDTYFCDAQIIKKSVDARKKDDVCFVYSFACENLQSKFSKLKNVSEFNEKKQTSFSYGSEPLFVRPVIAGAGPAGLFCGYYLAKHGFRPIIIERGEDIDSRTKTVDEFFKTKKLNPNSNVQFGEGGAGAFSDGKLTTRINDPLSKEVIDIFAKHSGICSYIARPHVGTDKLKIVVKEIRSEIISMGGEFLFSNSITDIKLKNGRVTGVSVNNSIDISTDILVLATGHSAKDMYKLLNIRGVSMEPKAFSVGARIEHKRDDINFMQYGKFKDHPNLSAADYQVWNACDNGHTAYSFCMCPGGVVVPSQSEENTIVVNGMSEYSRDMENSNSAICVGVSEKDYGNELFSGLEFIENLERNTFLSTNKTYSAPFTTTKQLTGINPKFKYPEPSYCHGLTEVDFSEILPEFVLEAITKGLLAFERKLRGFVTNGGILTAVETRTSSPLRILRNENFESRNVLGLYPCGEGAGYAGGIVSSAVDGIKTAIKIIEKYRFVPK